MISRSTANIAMPQNGNAGMNISWPIELIAAQAMPNQRASSTSRREGERRDALQDAEDHDDPAHVLRSLNT